MRENAGFKGGHSPISNRLGGEVKGYHYAVSAMSSRHKAAACSMLRAAAGPCRAAPLSNVAARLWAMRLAMRAQLLSARSLGYRASLGVV